MNDDEDDREREKERMNTRINKVYRMRWGEEEQRKWKAANMQKIIIKIIMKIRKKLSEFFNVAGNLANYSNYYHRETKKYLYYEILLALLKTNKNFTHFSSTSFYRSDIEQFKRFWLHSRAEL